MKGEGKASPSPFMHWYAIIKMMINSEYHYMLDANQYNLSQAQMQL